MFQSLGVLVPPAEDFQRDWHTSNSGGAGFRRECFLGGYYFLGSGGGERKRHG
jgi:hypothetical protein